MKQLLFVICLALLSYGTQGQEFKKENKNYRKKLNNEFNNPEKSPLTKEDFQSFKELEFFPLNEKYYVQANLTINTLPQLFKMPTTTDRLPLYSTYGILTFELNGTEYTLQVYQNQELKTREGYEDYLFVPFTDETNGIETYGGGRYLDFRIPESENVMIDLIEHTTPTVHTAIVILVLKCQKLIICQHELKLAC